jgi:hypothetical protein
LTRRRCTRILLVMHRIAFLLAVVAVAAVAALARPSHASAGWCWPNCSGYGMLGPGTSTYNGCWFSGGEVCSYYNSWLNMGMYKTCYPGCDWAFNTTGVVLYGFENHERIRGRFTTRAISRLTIWPADVGMSGMLRAQVTWYGGPASQLNAAAIG